SIRAAHETVRSLESSTLPEPELESAALPATGVEGPPAPGDSVWVRSLAREGIFEAAESSGRARVRVGNVAFVVLAAELVRTASRAPSAAPTVPASVIPAPEPGPTRLDLRGMERADAESALEGFLDRLLRDGAPRAEIVHGKGTGVLRDAVHRLLARH